MYIDIPPKEKIWLIDINPWKHFTNALLFTFEELEEEERHQE